MLALDRAERLISSSMRGVGDFAVLLSLLSYFFNFEELRIVFYKLFASYILRLVFSFYTLELLNSWLAFSSSFSIKESETISATTSLLEEALCSSFAGDDILALCAS